MVSKINLLLADKNEVITIGGNKIDQENSTKREDYSKNEVLNLIEIEKENEKGMLTELMQKEEKLRSLKKKGQAERKSYNKVVYSKTWKYTNIFRCISRAFNNIKGSFSLLISLPNHKSIVQENKHLLEKNEKLLHKLVSTEEQLIKAREQIKMQLFDLRRFDSKELHNLAKKEKENGELVNYLTHLIARKEISEKNYCEALRKVARLYSGEKKEYRQIVYSKTLEGFKIEDIPEFIVRVAETEKELSLKKTASFRASLTMRARLRQLREARPEVLLDNKRNAYQFIDAIKGKRPWVREKKFKFAEIKPEEGIVIKPYYGAGARGVYQIFKLDKIRDVRRARNLNSWEELSDSIREDISNGWVEEDKWIIEELITNNSIEALPPRDYKFYCFYGNVGLILEVVRYPELKYCWWTSEGEQVNTGKYEEHLFKGDGVTGDQIEHAALISKQIPVPFIRVDFLKSGRELIFGEFTPKPGNYDEFDESTDQLLGDYYLDAEERLIEDLLNGKQFDIYNDFKRQVLNK
ncbi:ATP-grasp fold amidoligase family protein [Evansella clarkii]|uniref:ATP-grasp fold amidoligase family protein n=1 Tax=Evansella clarkii TaxID=79879 RepID=UPI000B43A423|nr:ATP-grasp fold amidoligase family protein [Evansella clarkii]